MTLQLEIIRSCDLIVLPAVSKEECYAYRIVGQVCPEISDMPLLCMPFPMIKDEKKLELAHTRIYETIEDYLRCGQIVGMHLQSVTPVFIQPTCICTSVQKKTAGRQKS